MDSSNHTELKICLGKLDYLSVALKNLSNSNGSLEEALFRENVREISCLLEGQVLWLQRNLSFGNRKVPEKFTDE